MDWLHLYRKYMGLDNQQSTSTVKKFYTMGSTTVAVRTVSGAEDVFNWILVDHLGSSAVTANDDGSWNSEIKYTAFGEVRASNGLTPTEYRYTGQLEQNSLGLYFYVARWYDPYLNHFIQADTYVPEAGNAKAFDRYGYAINDPINFNDPTGHFYNPLHRDGVNDPPPPSPLDLNILADRAREYATTHNGNPVEIWAATSDFVAWMVDDDAGSYMLVMNNVFARSGDGLEDDFGDSGRDGILRGFFYKGTFTRIRSESSEGSHTVIGESALKGSDGFHSLYSDPIASSSQSNQVHHCQFYIQLGYYHGALTGFLANLFHETIQPMQDNSGKTIQDFLAGEVGVNIGIGLYYGEILPGEEMGIQQVR